jgi:hypothetical protein
VSDEEINVAIAEACGIPMFGLKKRGYWYRPNARGYTDRNNEAGRYTLVEAKKHEYKRGNADERVTIFQLPPPDYCNDLNAMHGAEKIFDGMDYKFKNKYVGTLEEILEVEIKKEDPECIPDVSGFEMINATAHQRAEAFLKTIQQEKGK